MDQPTPNPFKQFNFTPEEVDKFTAYVEKHNAAMQEKIDARLPNKTTDVPNDQS